MSWHEVVRVSAHTFRHTFAKFYLQRGGEVFKLSREMGHSTVQVTEIYLKDYRSSEGDCVIMWLWMRL